MDLEWVAAANAGLDYAAPPPRSRSRVSCQPHKLHALDTLPCIRGLITGLWLTKNSLFMVVMFMV